MLINQFLRPDAEVENAAALMDLLKPRRDMRVCLTHIGGPIMFDELPTGLKNFRTHLGIGAADMAPLMGILLGDYVFLEENQDLLTPLHVKAALFAAIIVAAHHRGYSALPHELSDLLKRLPRA